MLRQILPDDAVAAVETERALLKRVRDLAHRFEPGGAETRRVKELIAHLDDMFLLVVVGEVKAGKSAFINALLDADVCPEGPTPLTDRVHVLAYGEDTFERALEEHVLRRTLPVASLERMNVVDTPGTNSPLLRHQEITEAFLPRADIVFFVTSIDCPLTHTEIELLKQIHERWRKEVACVLAKVDMHPAEDRPVVLQYLQDSFAEHLGFNPPVFPVSSHMAREARREGDDAKLEASGLPAVEHYIVENLSESQRVLLKLKSPLGTAQDIVRKIDNAAASRLAVLERDFAGWKTLDDQVRFAAISLGERAERYLTPVAVSFENLEARGRAYLRDAFRLGNLATLSNTGKFAEEFEREVVRNAATEIEGKVEKAVEWLAGETASLWERSLAHFEEHVSAEKYRKEILTGSGPEFERTRRETIDGIVETARQEFSAWSVESECARIRALAASGKARLLVVEGVALTLGASVMATILTSVLGVLGLTLAAGVALGGFFILPARRRKAIEGFETSVRGIRQATLAALRDALNTEAERASGAVLDAFAPFADFYRIRSGALEEVRAEAAELIAEVKRMQAELG